MSARAKKRARQNAKKPLMLLNGGVQDGTASGSAGGPGKGKSKGKTKGDDTHDGKPICYNWNRGAPCKQNPCPWAHVCLICKKDHPKSQHA